MGLGLYSPRRLWALEKSAGSELGSQALLVLDFEPVSQAHIPHLEGKECDSLISQLVGRCYPSVEGSRCQPAIRAGARE